MKIAIIADIHSNYAALEACLESVRHEKADGIVFLGDYVSDCPYSQKTLALVRQMQNKYKTWLIRGNREEYLIQHHRQSKGWKYSSGTGSLLYTYENLTEADITFFESLPIALKVEPEGCKPFTVCHGSPFKVRDWILGNIEQMEASLQAVDTVLLVCGHTHRYWKTFRNNKTILFAPSIGLPADGLDSRYLMLEYNDGFWTDRTIFVAYDKKKFISDFYASGFNDQAFFWAKAVSKMVESNDNFPLQCLKLAEKYSREDNNLNPAEIPEKYWARAAQELGIE